RPFLISLCWGGKPIAATSQSRSAPVRETAAASRWRRPKPATRLATPSRPCASQALAASLRMILVCDLNPLFAESMARSRDHKSVGLPTKLSCHRKDEGLEVSIAYRRIRLPAAPAAAYELARSFELAARIAAKEK